MKFFWIFPLIMFFALGCQMKPTKVKETSSVGYQRLQEKAGAKLSLTPGTRIVDVRSSFEFAMMHIPGSINLDWKQFALNSPPAPGRLLPEVQKIARSLALKGLDPAKPVIVVGDGQNGKGEEGRVAWMLVYLGFNDVQVSAFSQFKDALTNSPSAEIANAPAWQANPRTGLDLSRKDFLLALKKRTQGEAIHILDVRTKEEYFQQTRGGVYETPDLQAMHIDWREFFLSTGRPNVTLRHKLTGVGVKPEDRVIVMSEQGVRSGAVTWALLAMGYNRVTNYSGGLSELKVPGNSR